MARPFWLFVSGMCDYFVHAIGVSWVGLTD